MPRMTPSEAMVETLRMEGVTACPGIVGSAFMDALDLFPAAGIRFVWRTKIILATMTLDLFAVLLGGAIALMPYYADEILHLGPVGLGWLRAAPGVGAGLVGLTLAFRPIRRAAGRRLFVCVALFASLCSHAVSLQVFATVFGELTNDIATIESNFDNSPVQKEKLAVLVRARSAILNPEMGDAEALATLVRLLGQNGDYVAVLDESAVNARASVLSDYTALGIRVAELPPSIRTTRARNRFNSLSADAAALGNAQHAAGISQQLAPFGRQLVMATAVAERAQVLPRPNVRRNSVRAVVNGRVFAGGGNGRRSPFC